LTLVGLVVACTLGCNSLVRIDVDCKKLCLTSPGPTIPGSSSLLPSGLDGATPDLGPSRIDGTVSETAKPLAHEDGGSAFGLDGMSSTDVDAGAVLSVPDASIPAPLIEWVAELRFNEVLGQLPSAAAGVSANVRLGAVSLASTTDLEFIDSVDVVLSHGRAPVDGGAEGNEEPDAGVDAGESPNTPPCKAAGVGLLVAHFRRTDGVGFSGTSISLVVVDPKLNLFDCLKDEPGNFDVKMTLHQGAYPASDAPLSLDTCIAAEADLDFP